MPGTSGPSVSVSLIGKRSTNWQALFATASTQKAFLRFAGFLALIVIFAAAGFAQGAGDITDVHIAPRAKAEPASAVASPDVSTPSIGLKTTDRRIKVDVNLVLVPVTVTDPMNRLVTGLERENFLLSEGSQGQQIRSFSSEDAPLSLGVIFDLSGSMSNKIEKSKQAVVEFYAIALFDNSAATPEERYGPYLLNEISDVTGGRMFRVDDVNELADVATKIGVELRNQYVLGYRPINAAHDGKSRKIKVKLNAPKGLPPLT